MGCGQGIIVRIQKQGAYSAQNRRFLAVYFDAFAQKLGGGLPALFVQQFRGRARNLPPSISVVAPIDVWAADGQRDGNSTHKHSQAHPEGDAGAGITIQFCGIRGCVFVHGGSGAKIHDHAKTKIEA